MLLVKHSVSFQTLSRSICFIFVCITIYNLLCFPLLKYSWYFCIPCVPLKAHCFFPQVISAIAFPSNLIFSWKYISHLLSSSYFPHFHLSVPIVAFMSSVFPIHCSTILILLSEEIWALEVSFAHYTAKFSNRSDPPVCWCRIQVCNAKVQKVSWSLPWPCYFRFTFLDRKKFFSQFCFFSFLRKWKWEQDSKNVFLGLIVTQK